tara:strand:- start:828 stop:1100 length:273 start_codon:yes stop_codon:yes gene_type:complete
MKFAAILRVAKIIEWATGDDYDKCVKWREDDQFGCIIGYDDLLNIEDEIRSAYEMGYGQGLNDRQALSQKPHDRHALSNKLITNALKRGD